MTHQPNPTKLPEEVRIRMEKRFLPNQDRVPYYLEWNDARDFIAQELALQQQAYGRERSKILEALCEMWEQYCPPPYTHMFMGAGEDTEEVLEDLGLLNKDKTVNWEALSPQSETKEAMRTYGDGHYCTHHPDDPAHGSWCYESPGQSETKEERDFRKDVKNSEV